MLFIGMGLAFTYSSTWLNLITAMKLEKPQNNNYCCTVVELKNIVPLTNCDNLVGTTIFGFQAIITKDHKKGDIGIVFPAETQLSDEYCRENNLYRHSDKNKDENISGYIEDNRRVKAIKFRGNVSNCLFMELESLRFAGIDPKKLKVGDEFDILNSHEICKKYVVREKQPRENKQRVKKKFTRVEPKFMPEHFDTDNFFKWSSILDPDTEVIVTTKLHGSSIRLTNTVVLRKLNLLEKAFKRLGVKIQETEFDTVFGSRRVVKDPNNPDHKHFYDYDIWTTEGKKYEGIIPQNYIIYGELIGWTQTGAPIQERYTYGIKPNECELYVYRIAIINNQGLVQDLCWDHLKEFCKETGFKYVPELWRGKLKDFKVEDYLDKRFYDYGFKQSLWLGEDESIVDEGVCIRIDKKTPYIMKAKGSRFLEIETKLLDKGTEDLEASQS